MASVTVNIEGLAELKRNVQELTAKVRKKVLGGAVAAGSRVVLREAKQKAPVKTGALREAIKQRRSRKFSKQDFEVRQIGVFKVKGGKYANTRVNRRLRRVGKEYESDPPEFYWRFLEFGTVKMKPRPFLRPAFEARKREAADKIVSELRKRLDAAIKELPR